MADIAAGAKTAETSAARTNGRMPAGVGFRLLLAFAGIASFAILAALAGIYALQQLGDRLESVESRVAPTLAALELSRSTERIIAGAPALLAATDPSRIAEIRAGLRAETEQFPDRLRTLRDDAGGALLLDAIEIIVADLTAGLTGLEEVATRRLAANTRLARLRRDAFAANDAIRRLLAPWFEVTAGEIDLVIAGESRDAADPQGALARHVEAQRAIQTAQRQASAAADLLAETSTTEARDRLPVLAFQTRLSLDDIEETATRLDRRLRPLFLKEVARLRSLTDDPNAVWRAREEELKHLAQASALLAEVATLSARLTGAIDALGKATEREIGAAVDEAVALQRLSVPTLVALAALSLLTSLLIVWLYVGRSIVRRLAALSDGVRAIAAGRLATRVPTGGRDEIAAMADAVEVFRRNAIELDRLLEERRHDAARLERVVGERTRQLADANLYKSRFLAAASHDLRQPLHALNLFVGQLVSGTDRNDRRRLVAGIEAAVASMNDLFGTLLDVSKLEAGLVEPEISAFPAQHLLDRLETTFSPFADERGLRLRVVPSTAWLRSDIALLERILSNLAANAIRHTHKGGIVIGCRRRHDAIRIDVCDSGPGIPPEMREQVFSEFFRIPQSGGRDSDGLGLGLAIVDRLARLLEHPIALDSLPGSGSRFSVEVPRAEPAHEALALTQPAPADIDGASGRLVVVIDNDPLVLESMRGTLEGWGCNVVAVDSSAAAIAAVGSRFPDLVVSDLRLAGSASGLQAIASLREAWGRDVPAFLISGDTAPAHVRDARANGLELVHKPVSPLRLRALVLHLLQTGEPDRRAAG